MSTRKSRTKGGSGPSQRQLRAAELVRHALVDLLLREELADPELAGVRVTVGEVRASPDLKHMHAFVAPLGGGDAQALARALNRAAPYLRGKLGRLIEMRFTPELHFLADESYEQALRIDAALARLGAARETPARDEEE